MGIQVGTAITTLVRKADHAPAETVGFRHLWGQAKREELTDTAETETGGLYESIAPVLPLGLPFAAMAVNGDWQDWPALPDLFPTSFPGVKTSRDSFLIDVDLDRLKRRMNDYFNPDFSHEDIALRYPTVMTSTAGFDARAVRNSLLAQGGPNPDGFVRHTYRPFDTRWLYWEPNSGLLDRPRPDYKPHVFDGNLWLGSNKREIDEKFSHGSSTNHLGNWKPGNWGIHFSPAWLRDDGLGLDGDGTHRRPNLSPAAQRYLDRLGLGVEDLFHHVLAVLHDPAYREANAGALRMEWPRIPLPGWPDGDIRGAAEELAASAERGRELAALLDSETPVPGVTTGTLRPEMASIGVPATADGRNMTDDFSVTAGWGHFGTGDAVMPGHGRAEQRPYTAAEHAALGEAITTLGETNVDVYLNKRAYWRNVPMNVWNYKLGGYQVLKKWLSYREQKILDRPLTPEEVQDFTDTARRIGGILLLVNDK